MRIPKLVTLTNGVRLNVVFEPSDDRQTYDDQFMLRDTVTGVEVAHIQVSLGHFIAAVCGDSSDAQDGSGFFVIHGTLRDGFMEAVSDIPSLLDSLAKATVWNARHFVKPL